MSKIKDKNLKFKTGATFETVVRDGLEQIDTGDGFEYIVGEIYGGNMKVVFEPAGSHDCVVIDGVNGFGYNLVFEDDLKEKSSTEKNTMKRPKLIRDWESGFVISNTAIENGCNIAPLGTTFYIRTAGTTAHLIGSKCNCCGIQMKVIIRGTNKFKNFEWLGYDKPQNYQGCE